MNASSADSKLVTWRTPEEMLQGWPVIRQMYTKMTYEEYDDRLKDISKFDYLQFAVVQETVSGENKCLGVIGAWCLPRIWCGIEIDIDNFVVDKHARSLGIGKRLFDQCLTYAEERGASIAVLDTFVDNPASHKFYFREGFSIRGYHFIKALKGQSVW